MQVFVRSACSPHFSVAFDRVMAGGNAKRADWPEGQFILLSPNTTDRIAVFRDNRLSSPGCSPSSNELVANDWVVGDGTTLV